MKKFDLGQTIQIAANIGVLAGIAFLAIEISQSNRIAAYTAENTRRALFADLNTTFLVSPELLALSAKLADGDPELTQEEEIQAGFLFRRFFNSWANSEEAYRNGLLSDFSWQSTLGDIDATFDEFPGMAKVYRRMAELRPGSGLDILNRIIENVERLESE